MCLCTDSQGEVGLGAVVAWAAEWTAATLEVAGLTAAHMGEAEGG